MMTEQGPAITGAKPAQERSLPFAFRRGPTICVALAGLVALVVAGLTVTGSALPFWFHLWMGAMSLGVLALGYVQLRRSALLEREGIRIPGTVIDQKVFYGIDDTAIAPVVRLKGPPFPNRLVRLPWRSRKNMVPIGSRLPILTHPTREIFDTDEPRPYLARLLAIVAISLAFVVLPAWAEWGRTY